ncbi:MAG: hypothetical protein C0620_07010 [Desulfuromonas sp.]|nr:MAG: hypothetical protein C0620_07010 [Desulfuromonas sp.]
MCLSNILIDEANRICKAKRKQTQCRWIQVQEKLSWFLHTFERQVKSMSAAGTKPGDLDLA